MTSLRIPARACVGVLVAHSDAACSSDPEGLTVPNGEGGASDFGAKGPDSPGGEAARGGKSVATVAPGISAGEISKGCGRVLAAAVECAREEDATSIARRCDFDGSELGLLSF